MQSVKNELLAALAAELDRLSPGAGAKAAFELSLIHISEPTRPY